MRRTTNHWKEAVWRVVRGRMRAWKGSVLSRLGPPFPSPRALAEGSRATWCLQGGKLAGRGGKVTPSSQDAALSGGICGRGTSRRSRTKAREISKAASHRPWGADFVFWFFGTGSTPGRVGFAGPVGAQLSRRISSAALRPQTPITPPPGWLAAPQRYSPWMGERWSAQPRTGRRA